MIVAMPSTLTPQAFVAKWRKSALKESAADREHFIDLCRLIGHETPAEADNPPEMSYRRGGDQS